MNSLTKDPKLEKNYYHRPQFICKISWSLLGSIPHTYAGSEASAEQNGMWHQDYINCQTFFPEKNMHNPSKRLGHQSFTLSGKITKWGSQNLAST